MCVISMVMDIGKTMPEEMWNPQTIDDFRKMAESARRIDTNAGQKDCVDPEKEKFMERLKLFERRYELSKRLTELRELTAEAVMELSDIDEKLEQNA